tara:strand:- start:355 stop:624 length:270 start_codon:yes stop_codon:yes gene_type:complete
MKKIKLSVAALLIASASFGQTQCVSLTKDSLQCKNVTKQSNQCYLHNANYVKPSKTAAVVCTGTTKAGRNCKNKTKNTNQLCHLHTKKD